MTLSSSCDNLLALHRDVSVTANVTTILRPSSSSPDQPLVAAQPFDLDPTDDATMAEDCAESSPPAAGFNKTTPCSPTSAMVSTQRITALSSSLRHLLRCHFFSLSSPSMLTHLTPLSLHLSLCRFQICSRAASPLSRMHLKSYRHLPLGLPHLPGRPPPLPLRHPQAALRIH